MKIFCKNYQAILIVFVLFAVSSCSNSIAKIFPNQATHEMDHAFGNASPEFKQGWADGCETGIAAGSNTFYKMFYRSNKADGYKMAGSPEYKTAWGNAFWYCYRYTYIKQKSSIWGSTFSGII